MMELLLIGGFLGSGKTTTLLEIIGGLKDRFETIVILENEVGDIGIDGNYLKDHGLTVQELFGGCICCTLLSDMVYTLEKIKENYNPDLIVMEATGVARPNDILDVIRRQIDFIEKEKVITVIDANRFAMLRVMLENLLTSQICTADLIAVNKIDEFSEGSLSALKETVAAMNPKAKILCISAENHIGTAKIVEELYG